MQQIIIEENNPSILSELAAISEERKTSNDILKIANKDDKKLAKKKKTVQRNALNELIESKSTKKIDFWESLTVLLNRMSKSLVRNKNNYTTRILQAFAYVLFDAIFFNQLGYDQKGGQNRIGAIFFTMVIICNVTVQN